jgi:thioesterase domain-containing protein
MTQPRTASRRPARKAAKRATAAAPARAPKRSHARAAPETRGKTAQQTHGDQQPHGNHKSHVDHKPHVKHDPHVDLNPHIDHNPYDAREHRAPSLALMALEWRAPLEFSFTLGSLPLLYRAPSGDGHSVLVFPGLIAGDVSTLPLRGYLKSRGYDVEGWLQGLNLGPRPGVLERSEDQVRQIARDSGRKLSLIGWSLGGIYAREIAKQLPECVRCVITLGTPFTGHPRSTNAWRLYELASGHKIETHPKRGRLHEAPPVPTTSIYSRTDGVVAWECSVQDARASAHGEVENIEVVASHLGLGMNPAALYAIADRLAQPEGLWAPFHRQGWRSMVYPESGDR